MLSLIQDFTSARVLGVPLGDSCSSGDAHREGGREARLPWRRVSQGSEVSEHGAYVLVINLLSLSSESTLCCSVLWFWSRSASSRFCFAVWCAIRLQPWRLWEGSAQHRRKEPLRLSRVLSLTFPSDGGQKLTSLHVNPI